MPAVLVRPFLVVLLTVLTLADPSRAAADPWLTVTGERGPGVGRTIVLISGDEEYRSEEALPQLARILAARHGFTCHVLFAIDPVTGEINPDVRTTLPGLERLADADLMVIATRFRALPDAAMAHIDRFVQSGRPIIGLRTATHAFAPPADSAYAHYAWNHDGAGWPGGFGRAILGETWIAHHGQHGVQGTRGVVEPAAREHPITRGIEPGSVFGDTDVYRVRLPLPDDCTTILRGAVTTSLDPASAAVDGAVNDPMMPITWTRDPAPHGGRVFTTTLGAATDFTHVGTRRLFVNAVYWALGMDAEIPESGTAVELVGPYAPSAYGFGGWVKGRKPALTSDADTLRLRSGQADTDPDSDTDADTDPDTDTDSAPAPAPDTAPDPDPAPPPPPVFLLAGNTTAERLAQSGLFELIVHAAHGEERARVVQVPWSGDSVTERPREVNVPTLETWIERTNPSVIVFSTGAVEAYDAAARATYRADLDALVRRWRARPNQPEVVLITPITVEPTASTPRAIARAAAHRAHVEAIVADIHSVAAMTGARVVDAAAATAHATGGALTTNGIHPTDRGCAVIAEAFADTMGWLDTAPAPLDAATRATVATARRTCCDRHFLERLRYRPTNTEYVWGRRHEPFGVVNFPPEMAQLDRMIDARTARLNAMTLPAPATVLAAVRDAPSPWPTTPSRERLPEDDWTPAAVEAKGTETSLGALEIDAPDDARASFTVAPGYVIECFASEQDFPELANPLAMAFDDRHRLWVLCTPTYPHLLPGARGMCRLIVLEDTDRDGRADHCSTFADELIIPTGFAIDVDTVYLGAAPDLLRLRDSDGDGRADETTIVASGFGMCDSHHQISAFEWDPAGSFVMHEGVFTRSNIETPRGTIRTHDAAVWRVDPRTGDLTLASHASFANPWGHVFDDYGASILADASGGDNHVFSYVAVGHAPDAKPRIPGRLLNRGRPTAGCELLSGRHFPESVHGTFLVNQSIGFHGTRWDRVIDDGSSWRTERMPHDLLSSTDTNFRPVAMEQGPDGALYITDWCNPIIGHMQYSVRDPRRDHAHGRIWRVRHESRPLVTPPVIDGASIEAWLELLRLPERTTRQLVRRRLQRAPWTDVAPRLNQWRAALAPDDPLRERLQLEALWIRVAHGTERPADLERVLRSTDPKVRAAGVRTLRHRARADRLDHAAALRWLETAADDPDMRVRLEAIVAASVLPPELTVAVLARTETQPMDDAMRVVFDAAMDHVTAQLDDGDGIESELVARSRIERLGFIELMQRPLDDLTAAVVVRRPRQALDRRRAALAVLAGDDDDVALGRAALAAARTVRQDVEAASLAELLFMLPDAALDVLDGEARELADDHRPGVARLAHAFAVRRGADGDLTPEQRVRAAAFLPASAVPESTRARIEADVATGRVAPLEGMLVVARLRGVAATAWLDAFVADSAGVTLAAWSPAHERAMAALRVLGNDDRHSASTWRIARAPDERLARGTRLYHDDAVGCARCHGADGTGMEGFPPLAASPWVVGDDGSRAAAIVIDGLSGALPWHDGRRFDAVMDPLGAVLTDEEIADVLTFVRQRFGNFAPAVAVSTVTAVRHDSTGAPWAVARLLQTYPMANDVLVEARDDATTRAAEASTDGTWVRWLLTHLALPLGAAALIAWWLERRAT